jgi:hypothetical protein
LRQSIRSRFEDLTAGMILCVLASFVLAGIGLVENVALFYIGLVALVATMVVFNLKLVCPDCGTSVFYRSAKDSGVQLYVPELGSKCSKCGLNWTKKKAKS